MNSNPINWQPDHLRNELISLIPLRESDFDTLYEIASDPLLWEQHPNRDRYKREVFMKFFQHAIDRGSAFLISDNATQQIIGSSGYYDYRPENSSIAVGYTFIARAFWGGLYNKASKDLLLNYAFQYVNSVYFYIGAPNYRSQKAITRIGAIKIREFFTDENDSGSLTFEYLIDKLSWQNTIHKIQQLTILQENQVNALWNTEFPMKLKDRFPILLKETKKACHYLIGGSDKEVKAWAVSFERDNEVWFSLIVDQAYQGVGLGHLLMEELKAENSELCGWVIDHDRESKINGERYKSPVGFYAKHGFQTESGHRIDTDLISAVKIRWKQQEQVLVSGDGLTTLAMDRGIRHWSELVAHVKQLPYGRNSTRDDFSLVLKEQKGTCSSKHAFLKRVAGLNGIRNVRLILAIYKMNPVNTPNIGNVLQAAGLPYLPEAHCYLVIKGAKQDLTSSNADFGRIEKDILFELEIEPEQVSDFKVAFHQDFLKNWIREAHIPLSFEEVWSIREQCIKNLEKQSCE